MKKIVIVGGGPAGLIAAGTAAANGNEVILYEKNKYLGKKLRITGKGRCNVTNRCSREDLLSNVTQNSAFLYGAFSRFDSEDTIHFFEGLGVPLKTERGNRVFPESDKAEDIVNALVRYCRMNGVSIRHDAVTGLKIEEGQVCGILTGDHKTVMADSVILATGGKSYPLTGSTGDGYRFAQTAGHTITQLTPSLVPLNAKGDICQRMQGLSLKNIEVRLFDQEGNMIFSDFGEMLFTHFGVSGPVILSASAHMRKQDACFGYRLEIDLKPGLDEDTLDRRLIRDFEKFSKKNFINALDDLLPQKMIPIVVELAQIDGQKKASTINRQERMALLHILKAFPIEIDSMRSIDEAIVTSGGIACNEINPKTMESKLVKGLHFAGELIDVDAYTGGFNLQIAFSTGYLAGLYA
jgi:predicted Rossmann fold flavoprotein